MIPLQVNCDLDAAPWTDLAGKAPVMGAITRIGRLPRGTTSGKSTIAVVIDLPDGTAIIAETTMDLFKTAGAALIQADMNDETSAKQVN